MKTTLVRWLLRLYPKAWRAEYGAELGDMLQTRPLTARVCIDIVSSAIWQRTRAVEAPTWVGVGLMLAVVSAIVSNIVAPAYYRSSILPEHIELLQKPMRSEFYVFIMLALGFWTAVKRRAPGRAVIRASLIESIPIFLVGVLMAMGVLDYTELNPGQTLPSLAERGIVYTYYKGIQQIPGPAPLAFLLSPLLRLPGACLWGMVGGALGQKYASWRRRPISI